MPTIPLEGGDYTILTASSRQIRAILSAKTGGRIPDGELADGLAGMERRIAAVRTAGEGSTAGNLCQSHADEGGGGESRAVCGICRHGLDRPGVAECGLAAALVARPRRRPSRARRCARPRRTALRRWAVDWRGRCVSGQAWPTAGASAGAGRADALGQGRIVQRRWAVDWRGPVRFRPGLANRGRIGGGRARRRARPRTIGTRPARSSRTGAPARSAKAPGRCQSMGVDVSRRPGGWEGGACPGRREEGALAQGGGKPMGYLALRGRVRRAPQGRARRRARPRRRGVANRWGWMSRAGLAAGRGALAQGGGKPMGYLALRGRERRAPQGRARRRARPRRRGVANRWGWMSRAGLAAGRGALAQGGGKPMGYLALRGRDRRAPQGRARRRARPRRRGVANRRGWMSRAGLAAGRGALA